MTNNSPERKSTHPAKVTQSSRHVCPWSNGERIFATATSGTNTYRRMRELAQTDKNIRARHELYQHRVVEELYNIVDDPDCLVNLIDDQNVTADLDYLCSNLDQVMVETKDHCLKPFRNRDDPAAMEAYVREKEKEAAARGKRTRSRQPNLNRKANLKLIELKIPKTIKPGGEITVQIDHKLSNDLGKQQLHVTLKQGANGARVERKVITITGNGTAEVTFKVPATIQNNKLHFAAFVGEEFAKNLQHVQVGPVEVGAVKTGSSSKMK